MRRPILVAVLVTVAAAVSGCAGHGDHGGGKASGSPTATAAPAGGATDRAFLNDMVAHHASAIEMARVALTRAERPELKALAAEIERTQEREIARMRALAADIPEGDASSTLGQSAAVMGMDHDTGALRSADPFDRAFLDMMTPHHEGALAMSQVVLDRGRDPQVKALARAIVAAQTREIAQMRQWRTAWFGTAGAKPGHSGGH